MEASSQGVHGGCSTALTPLGAARIHRRSCCLSFQGYCWTQPGPVLTCFSTHPRPALC